MTETKLEKRNSPYILSLFPNFNDDDRKEGNRFMTTWSQGLLRTKNALLSPSQI